MALAGMVMIHDESQTIARAVESFGKICDPIIGLDVGATDGAAEIAAGLGVELHAQEWTTHGAAAERLLGLARQQADYALLFGATETVEQTGDLPAKLDAPCYLVPAVHEAVVFRSTRVFDTSIEWTCPGPVHSTIQPDFFEERGELDGLFITVHDDDGRRRGKLERYRVELEEWLKEHPHDTRMTYYLAQTYYGLGYHTTAGGLYALRSRMSSADEEAWHARYMAACIALPHDLIYGMTELLECFRQRPHRMEPFHVIEQVCHQVRQQTPLPRDGESLAVMPEAYLDAD